MKPEASKGAVLEGQPTWVRTKRIGRFMTDVARAVISPTRDVEAARARRRERNERINDRGRKFVNALRGNFGESLQDGILVMPRVDEPYTVVLHAKADDTGTRHKTEASINIFAPEGENVAMLNIGAIQPTRAAKREPHHPRPEAWVNMVDPQTGRNFDSTDYNDSEQKNFESITGNLMNEVIEACDQGRAEVYQYMS
jgi:hypothetical protein